MGTISSRTLCDAAYFNNLAVVEQLLILRSDSNDSSVTEALHCASSTNKNDSHYEVIEALLRNAADVNSRDLYGHTPLDKVVRNGSVKMLQLYLSYGANYRAKNDAGENLLFPAAENNENADVIQLLIDLGLDVNHRCEADGKTPMHAACEKRSENIGVIKCLIKNGAVMDPVDYLGSTPLTEATETFSLMQEESRLKKKVFQFILEHSDVNKINWNRDDIFSYKGRPFYLQKMLLEHLARMASLGMPLIHKLLDAVSDHKQCSDYYNQCLAELTRAKTTKLPNSWVSFHNLLTDSRRKLKNYAGNENLIEEFWKRDCEKNFPIYGAAIVENVEKGMRRRKLFDEAAVLLSNCLPVLNPTHLIITDILNCILSKKDLTKFCND